MLIKRKKKVSNKSKINLINKLILYFKNFSSILLIIQLFVFVLIVIFYQSSQLSDTHPPKKNS